MPLTCVTITGADDSVKPEELAELSREFPFVEWGILIGSHSGARFPGVSWIKDLVSIHQHLDNGIKLSLHVCGKFLREIAAGKSTLFEYLGPELFAFRRVQLNWHGNQMPESTGENVLTAFCNLDTFGWDPTLIFQFDGVNNEIFQHASRRFACVGLFDDSHGMGVVPAEWSKASSQIGCGWAGGLGPDNLEVELPRIDAMAWKAIGYWVDMETKVRSDDDSAFDLAKVRQCLEICRPHVVAS